MICKHFQILLAKLCNWREKDTFDGYIWYLQAKMVTFDHTYCSHQGSIKMVTMSLKLPNYTFHFILHDPNSGLWCNLGQFWYTAYRPTNDHTSLGTFSHIMCATCLITMLTRLTKIQVADDPRKYNHRVVTSLKLTYLENLYVAIPVSPSCVQLPQ